MLRGKSEICRPKLDARYDSVYLHALIYDMQKHKICTHFGGLCIEPEVKIVNKCVP